MPSVLQILQNGGLFYFQPTPDLVISVDTATAHLAGALGKPVWLLNRAESEWRWLLERSDSPWYPSMRIFRQRQSRVWEPVVQAVAEALREVIGGAIERS